MCVRFLWALTRAYKWIYKCWTIINLELESYWSKITINHYSFRLLCFWEFYVWSINISTLTSLTKINKVSSYLSFFAFSLFFFSSLGCPWSWWLHEGRVSCMCWWNWFSWRHASTQIRSPYGCWDTRTRIRYDVHTPLLKRRLNEAVRSWWGRWDVVSWI